MRRFTAHLASILAIALISVLGLIGTANAEEESFTYTSETGKITFINKYKSDATVDYTTDDKSPVKSLVVPANGTASVESDTQHFMFGASVLDENGKPGLVGHAEWPGVNLSGKEWNYFEPLGVEAKPGSMTWFNENDLDVTLYYDDHQGLSDKVDIPAGKSFTLKSTTKNLTYQVRIENDLLQDEGMPGIDLSISAKDKPAKDKPAKPAKDKPAKSKSKSKTGKKTPSLPSTGV